MAAKSPTIVLSGLPGRMAGEVARLLIEQGDEFPLASFALVGPEITDPTIEFAERRFDAIAPGRRGELAAKIEALGPSVVVDFTLPAAIEDNVRLYCGLQVPFVMGTTGGSREWIRGQVEQAGLVAVVAPNMAIPIVLVQAAANWVAGNFPGALTGYQAGVRESHQRAKQDTSGTAKALVADMRALGPEIAVEQIEKVRDPAAQRAMGVPEAWLDGHAYHTYTVRSADSTVEVSLSHNVHGRRIYAEGTLWALRFLRARMAAGAAACCYSMIDVLRAMHELTKT